MFYTTFPENNVEPVYFYPEQYKCMAEIGNINDSIHNKAARL